MRKKMNTEKKNQRRDPRDVLFHVSKKEHQKEYRRKNRELQSEFHKKNPDYPQEYRSKNIERIRENEREYQRKNREKMNAHQNEYERNRTARLKELEIENEALQEDLGMALDEIARLGGEV
jgi:hypothetical protein